MRTWGTTNAEPGWDFAADAGLQRLAKSSNWTLTSATASTTLTDKGYGSYNAAEMTAINSSAYDGTTADYQRRVLVALGVYRWKSGKAGGQAGGNGDNRIDAGEIQTMIAYPSAASNPATFSKKVGGSWTAFVDYVSNSGSNMCKYDPSQDQYGDAGLRYRFGLKTFVDYLQEKCYGDSSSPGFGGAPTQPMGAVIDATNTALTVISDLQSNDLVGLAGYGTVGYSPADKPSGLSWLTDDMAGLNTKVSKFQAAMWTTNTNMAQGIDKGADVLMDSPDARPHAAKIMLLLTDGKPNQTRANPTQYYSEFSNPNPAATDAVAAATEARAQGIRIYTISVGVNADSDLMQQIASIGAGEHFHAEGSIEAYQAQLQDIFEDLGGKRPVQLIGSR
jgi:hypothetical protein